MIQDGFEESPILILVLYEMTAIIMSYRNDTSYSSLNEDGLEKSGILGDLIDQTIIGLIYTLFLKACKLIKKSPNSLEICLSNLKYNRLNLF